MKSKLFSYLNRSTGSRKELKFNKQFVKMCQEKISKIEVYEEFFSNHPKVNVNTQNIETGDTPLHYACQDGNYELTKLLFSKGAKTNTPNNSRFLPIHFAASNGRTKIVKELCKNGSLVDCECEKGMTPLHLAVREGFVDVVKVLLMNGADVSKRTMNGVAPLKLCKDSESRELIQRKLEELYTPAERKLHFFLIVTSLILMGDEKGLKKELLKCLDDEKNGINKIPLQSFFNEIPKEVKMMEEDNKIKPVYPLFLVIRKRRSLILENVLLKSEFRKMINFRIKMKGRNVLHEIIFEMKSLVDLEKKCEKKEELKAIFHEKFVLGYMFQLFVNVRGKGNIDLLEDDMLISYGGYDKLNLLMLSMMLKLDKALLTQMFFAGENKFKVNLFHVTTDKSNLLHFAVKFNENAMYNEYIKTFLMDDRVVETFPSGTIDMSVAKNFKGETPLFLAVEKEDFEVIKIIITSRKVDINEQNGEDKNTLLHLALEKLVFGDNFYKEWKEICDLILTLNCNVEIKNNKGTSALDVVNGIVKEETRNELLMKMKSKIGHILCKTIDVRKYWKHMKRITHSHVKPGHSEIFLLLEKKNELVYKRIKSDINDVIKPEEMAKKELSIYQEVKECPYVVKIHYNCSIIGYNGYLMEYCDRVTLFQLYKKSKLIPFSIKINILEQIAIAITYFHEKRIVHADLKPENILLKSNEENSNIFEVRLIDFGISFFLPKNLTSVKVPMEENFVSDHYASPERIKSGLYSLQCDSWAFGMIAYEFLFCKKIDAFEDKKDLVGEVILNDESSRKEYALKKHKVIEKNNISKLLLDSIVLKTISDEYHPLLEVIKKCFEKEYEKRPFFSKILREISRAKEYSKKVPLLKKVGNKHLLHKGRKNIKCFRCGKIYCDRCIHISCVLEGKKSISSCDCHFCKTCWNSIKIKKEEEYSFKICTSCFRKFMK